MIRGFLPKTVSAQVLADVVRTVHRGGRYVAPELAAGAISAVDRSVAPMTAALAAVTDVSTALVDRTENAAQRRAVISASAELQERERSKLAAVAAALEGALRQRDVEPSRARLTAQLATLIFGHAYEQWVSAEGRLGIAACVRSATDSLREATGE